MSIFHKVWPVLFIVGSLLGACGQDLESSANNPINTGPNSQPSNTQRSSTPSSSSEANSSSSSAPVTEKISWQHYANSDWFITVVQTGESLDYYGCEHSRINCLSLTDGTKNCSGGQCIYDWKNGSYLYRLTIQANDETILEVSKQNELIRTSQAFMASNPSQYTPEYDWIPDDRQSFLMVSESELGTVLTSLQQAAIEQDWELLARSAADTVLVNFDPQGTSQEVPRSQLPALLAKQDLSVWRARIITQTMADLFFHHDGIMIGQGDIWLEKPENKLPQIMTINFW